MPHDTDSAAHRAIALFAQFSSKLYSANAPGDFEEGWPESMRPEPEAVHNHRLRHLHGYEDTPADANAGMVAEAKRKAAVAGKGIKGLKDKILTDVLPAVVAEAGMTHAAKHVRDAATEWVHEGFELLFPQFARPWQTVVSDGALEGYREKFEPIHADLLALAKASRADEANTMLHAPSDAKARPAGAWLTPTTLADMANRLGNISIKKAKPILALYGLKVAGNRQSWTVRLDTMPTNMREKLERA